MKKNKKANLAVRDFVRRLLAIDKRFIHSIKLYGSLVRGDYKPQESDIDILVIGDNNRIDKDLLDLETKISLEYGVMLSVLFNTPGELKMIKRMGYSFARELEQAEVLYERG